MSKTKRGGWIALALFLTLVALGCLGAMWPDMDAPSPVSQRRPYAIAFAIWGAAALACYHVVKGIAAPRILVEAALVFVVFLCLGLVLTS